MATGSTVYTVKAAVVALLQANSALQGVQITHSYPGEAAIKREAIYLDRPVIGRHEIANMKAGRKQRNETYALPIGISVVKPKGTVADAEQRAFDLLQEIEDMLADDPSLGDVDGVVHATAGDFRMVSDYTSEGAACVITFDVDVDARLS